METLCFFSDFFKILPKFSDFVNSDDCIEKKTHENLSDYNQFLLILFCMLIKKQIFYCEKMRNSGNSYSDYGHLFFGKDF